MKLLHAVAVKFISKSFASPLCGTETVFDHMTAVLWSEGTNQTTRRCATKAKSPTERVWKRLKEKKVSAFCSNLRTGRTTPLILGCSASGIVHKTLSGKRIKNKQKL